jgi:hypothetical protein
MNLFSLIVYELVMLYCVCMYMTVLFIAVHIWCDEVTSHCIKSQDFFVSIQVSIYHVKNVCSKSCASYGGLYFMLCNYEVQIQQPWGVV